MKQQKKGVHFAKNTKSKKHIIVFCVILLIILICVYFIITYINHKDDNKEIISENNYSVLSDSRIVKNSDNLISKDLLITKNNGISKVDATIENTSISSLKNLNFIFTLYDNSDNIVHEFEIYISDLEANDLTSFSSVSTKNLSNVVNYSVTLSEQKID